jgi:hypothetical protein
LIIIVVATFVDDDDAVPAPAAAAAAVDDAGEFSGELLGDSLIAVVAVLVVATTTLDVGVGVTVEVVAAVGVWIGNKARCIEAGVLSGALCDVLLRRGVGGGITDNGTSALAFHTNVGVVYGNTIINIALPHGRPITSLVTVAPSLPLVDVLVVMTEANELLTPLVGVDGDVATFRRVVWLAKSASNDDIWLTEKCRVSFYDIINNTKAMRKWAKLCHSADHFDLIDKQIKLMKMAVQHHYDMLWYDDMIGMIWLLVAS